LKMPSKLELPQLIAIVGATAVGKTAAALQIADRLGGEIISADARTFYRGMDIGTAKPSELEQGDIRHHLISVADPDETWSLARFQREAHEAIRGVLDRGNLPILVGGSGQYVRAITEGWLPPKIAPNERMRKALERWADEVGVENLHARLAQLDAEAADKMEARNLRRIVRALEVIFSTGRKFSDQKGKGDPRYEITQIGLHRSREAIYERIDMRLEAMMQAGFLEEVRGLIGAGYSPDLPSFSAIGYRQLAEHLDGKATLEDALTEIRRVSRRFVRRQANWFKADDANIHWFDLDENGEAIYEIVKLIRGKMEKRNPK